MLIRPPVAAHNIVALWHRTTSCDITCIYSYPQGAREADSLMLCPGTWFGLLSCPTVVSSVHSVASLAPRPVWNCQTSLGMRLTVGRNCQKLCYIPNTTSSKYTQVYQRFNIPDVSWVCHLDSTLQTLHRSPMVIETESVVSPSNKTHTNIGGFSIAYFIVSQHSKCCVSEPLLRECSHVPCRYINISCVYVASGILLIPYSQHSNATKVLASYPGPS